MTAEAATQIQRAIRSHLSSEVDCQLLSEADGRVGCVTPIEVPNGDRVVVWVRPRNGSLEVTDYGETLADYAGYKGAERTRLEEVAVFACRGQGIAYDSGRLTTQAEWADVGDSVWRLAMAAAQIAHSAGGVRTKREPQASEEFTHEVESTLRSRPGLRIERERKVEGRSGHSHRATIFLPSSHAVLEPITGHMNQVNATYTKFGDLMKANGFKLYSLLDDRKGATSEDVASLLVQVSNVVAWSRHDEWLEGIL